MKEISAWQMAVRFVARLAFVSGLVALLIWITWLMLDIQHLQTGFTLP